MRQHAMGIANVTCHFGAKVLLDYAREIVLPSFFDDTLIRKTKGSYFFFYDIKPVVLEDGPVPVLGIIGQLVRNTVLVREQKIDGKRLVHDKRTLESAPSTFFCFVLNTHKLLYVSMTSHAPDLNSFKSTLREFMQIKYEKYIKKLSETEGKEEGELRKIHIAPKLSILPLSSRETISVFVNRYQILKMIKLSLSRTNDEIATEEIYRGLREIKNKLKSRETTLTHKRNDGLDKDEAVEQIGEAIAAGNATINLSGVDTEGNILKGNNDNFRLEIPLVSVPESGDKDFGKMCYGLFQENVKSGIVKADIPGNPEKTKEIINDLSNGWEE